MLGSMLYQPQPIIVFMEQNMLKPRQDETINIAGKPYKPIMAFTNYIDNPEPKPDTLLITYNAGMYILRNPYPKDLPPQSVEQRPVMVCRRHQGLKTLDYLLLINVKNIKLKVGVTSSPDNPPLPPIALHAGDISVDIKELGSMQDISISFDTRKTMTTLYIDVKDVKDEPTNYEMYSTIDAWEFTS